MSSRKRKILTLEERVKVVDRLTSGESARSIALSLGVDKTQIQSIGKEKDELKWRRWQDGWQDGENADRTPMDFILIYCNYHILYIFYMPIPMDCFFLYIHYMDYISQLHCTGIWYTFYEHILLKLTYVWYWY